MSEHRRAPLLAGRAHVRALVEALAALDGEHDRIESWGRTLAEVLDRGGRVLVAGNGGSAAQAQHLAGELVGRYRDDRPAFSAVALCADSSILTAIVNDYGAEEVFARQVRGHGRPGDVLVTLSTSGRSPNVVAAAHAASALGLHTLALTGPGPNPLATASDDAVCATACTTATIQEVHQVVVHLLCATFDCVLGFAEPVVDHREPA